ncbi:MAG TPA: potassium transporter KtrA [Flavobacteriales bacterium]|nr:potassium transporter KtrA [Flavobacteriales bacterium]HRE75721.1 TrkA family potassium uptake protein [Flavobacteriales bacterium]HRE95978.1 TrkA family potassium uptake protein [Flavobacteriales bacterium]HRJ34674.1 TrkA family potassium uptake protein [Flavobacteriales bacterium]HRJ38153.1 TrkA family potassium uptake protein [Flavobacteriales bacterium]
MPLHGNKFAVIGVGRYGSSIARRLAQKGAEVYCFDQDEEKIDNVKDDVAYAATLDSTDDKALVSQNISDVDGVVVAIGENFEATILTCAHLIDLGIKRVIARAHGPQQKMILEKIGVKEILLPEEEVAFVVAERLLNPSILSFLQLPDDYEIAEIRAPKNIVNRTLNDIGLRDKYRLTLITIKRSFDGKDGADVVKEDHILGVPKSESVVYDTDTLIIFGTSHDVARFIDINQ